MEHPWIWLHVTLFLDTTSTLAWIQTCRVHRTWFRAQHRQWNEFRAGIAMAHYIRRHLRVQLQVHSQEAQQHSIPRSDDPRVPPRVETLWIEHGPMASETVVIPTEMLLPFQHPRRNLVTLNADCKTLSTPPMLVHAVNGTRRLYSVIRLVQLHGDDEDTSKELRRFIYHPQMGDLKAVPLLEKHQWAREGHPRFDVVSMDGACQLELNVPAHVEATVDCYHIQRIEIAFHKFELFPLTYHRSLAGDCNLQMTFYDAKNKCVGYIHASGSLGLEPSSFSTPQPTAASGRTAIEALQVYSLRPSVKSMRPAHLGKLLRHPGMVVFSIHSNSSVILHSLCLHNGTTTSQALKANWDPGCLEYALAPQTLDRRLLKGWLSLAFDADAAAVTEMNVAFQYVPPERLQRYAARFVSACGLP
ncbi:unnamed protein product [Aphanomyces euteiches]|uniref:Uncharacterized protein n=1 Tax=Aphanomyces euteiches TaxID=100861 RepID=A0A6G0XF37_9STRA|nr:hypothetical protein Ae201684_005455 [Aphanomyces euteiches]KAH9136785.1 hypothetical protein AeRB84_018230 [Aphanomyces euteiches]